MSKKSKEKREEEFVFVNRGGRKIRIPKKEYDRIPEEVWFER